jgi:hypothetical protein
MTRRWRVWVLVQFRTTVHKAWVAFYLLRYALTASSLSWALCLLLRALAHDVSKYRPAEARAFVDKALLPVDTPHDSPVYQDLLRSFEHQVDLHYASNSHHPEHHGRGYAGMSELDRIEMVADWAAATRRLRLPGGVDEWIVERADRYGYDEDEVERLRGIGRRMGVI